MKKLGLTLATASLMVIGGMSTALAASPNKTLGPHDYQLLMICTNVKNADMDNNNGRRIFVLCQGRTTIKLREGDYAVIDANGTDGEATFQLPDPDPDYDGETVYQVHVRALGAPGGWATIQTCALDDSGIEWCGTASDLIMRDSGNKPKWQNVTRAMLYVEFDIDGDGKLELVPLFDDALEGYLWYYDNNGLRVAQYRFFPVPYDVCVEAKGNKDSGGYCELG